MKSYFLLRKRNIIKLDQSLTANIENNCEESSDQKKTKHLTLSAKSDLLLFPMNWKFCDFNLSIAVYQFNVRLTVFLNKGHCYCRRNGTIR